MRVLILGVSTLALGACSMGGGGWSHHQGHGVATGYSHSGYYGSSQTYGQTVAYDTSGCGVAVNPCAPTTYVPPAPVAPPVPTYTPCAVDPCSAGTYAVSPYAPASSYATTPDAHAYGSYHGYGHGHHGKLRGPHKVGDNGHFYGTLGGALVDVDEGAVALQGRLGYQATEYFGAELEGTVGVISDKEDLGGGDELRTNIDYGGAIFATARIPVGDRLNIFARGGYHVTEVGQTADVGGVETDASETIDDFAYGAGIEYAFTPRDSIRADYTRYEGGTNFTTPDTVSLSWLRRF